MTLSRVNSIADQRRDWKKQRRGLAEISLKVKNIVTQSGTMAFKDVSEAVLKESFQDLPVNEE